MDKQWNDSNYSVMQMHPYQHLTRLNNVFMQCNKASTKSYSSVSKMKLPWKPFNIMKIPSCFETAYAQNHIYDRRQQNTSKEVMDENQKKFWREHEEILKRYTKNKVQQRKQQQKRPKTAKLVKKDKGTNMHYTRSPLGDISNNVFLNRILEKGANLQYDKEQLQGQVLQKLKNINDQSKKKLIRRVQSAKNDDKFSKQYTNLYQRRNGLRSAQNQRVYQKKPKIDVQSNDYLTFDKAKNMLSVYKERIKQVDCSISEMNIKKTVNLLKKLESASENLE